jgi:glycosyltransferase involved in cell wall biosynthesis
MKRNVLYFIYGLGEGGAEHQMLQLAKRMKDSGNYRVHIACLLRSGDLLNEAEQLVGEEVPGFPITSFYNRTMLVQLRRFAKYLRENEIEIVHTQDFYSNIFGMIGATLAGVPARVAFKGETDFSRSSRQRFAERCAFRLAHAVIANAEAVRSRMIREGVAAKKLVTIYNGIDLQRATPSEGQAREAVLASFGLPYDSPRRFVTIVANIQHAIKDHPMFLRAAQRMRKAIPDAAFVIAGQGQLKESLQAYAAELGLKDDVFFIGRCDRVGDLLGISEVGILSSKAEGFSNSILEYMAAALPVVATDVGGAREAVVDGETGYLVPSGDDVAMGEHIISLLRQPERARLMGQRGRQIVAEKFSWEAQVSILRHFYEQLLARKQPLLRGTSMVRRRPTESFTD